MGERRRLGVQDALWLEMDRPANLMVVDTVVWTATPIGWDRLRAVARHRLWDRYPAFRSVAVRGDDGAWYWEEPPGVDFEDHVSEVTLPKPGDDAALQDFIGSQRTVPLDRDKPLWHLFCIDGFRGGSAIVTRTHHAIADGIRLVQLAMSLFDASPKGGNISAPAVHLHAEQATAPDEPDADPLTAIAAAVAKEIVELTTHVASRVGDVVTDPLGAATEQLSAFGTVARSAAGTSVELATTAVTNPVGAAHSAATMRPTRSSPPPGGCARRCGRGSRAAARWSTSSPPCRATSTSPASCCSAPGTTRPRGPAPSGPTRRSPGRPRSRWPTSRPSPGPTRSRSTTSS